MGIGVYGGTGGIAENKDNVIVRPQQIKAEPWKDPTLEAVKLQNKIYKENRQSEFSDWAKGAEASGVNIAAMMNNGGSGGGGTQQGTIQNTAQKISGALGRAQLKNIESQTTLNKANAFANVANAVTGGLLGGAKLGVSALKAPASIVKNTTNQFSKHYYTK